MKKSKTQVQPYDVLQRFIDGQWFDYCTIRAGDEGQAVFHVTHGNGEFRITRHGDVILTHESK